MGNKMLYNFQFMAILVREGDLDHVYTYFLTFHNMKKFFAALALLSMTALFAGCVATGEEETPAVDEEVVAEEEVVEPEVMEEEEVAEEEAAEEETEEVAEEEAAEEEEVTE